MGPKKDRDAPNLVAISDRFNLISGWVRTSVMAAESNEERADLIEHFIAVALVRLLRTPKIGLDTLLNVARHPLFSWFAIFQECYDMNNFPSMLQIMLAIVSSSIDRLRSTWQVRRPPSRRGLPPATGTDGLILSQRCARRP